MAFDPVDDFDRPMGEPSLIVDVDGFEGPLELLLELARRQKIDLQAISILALAEQYIAFVETARTMRLELAADYLVMAAYLAFLKSRMMLPTTSDRDEPAALDLTEDLARRLRRLEAIRSAAEALSVRPRLGCGVFARGMPEAQTMAAGCEWEASLFELLTAYAGHRHKRARSSVIVRHRLVWSLARARELLETLTSVAVDWVTLEELIGSYMGGADTCRTVRASVFSASLEMVREGRLEMQQETAFTSIHLRTARGRVQAGSS